MKTFKDLSEAERDVFCKEFYDCWEADEILCKYEVDIDSGNPRPWGCPWIYAADDEFVSPDAYFSEYRNEILESLENEEIKE